MPAVLSSPNTSWYLHFDASGQLAARTVTATC